MRKAQKIYAEDNRSFGNCIFGKDGDLIESLSSTQKVFFLLERETGEPEKITPKNFYEIRDIINDDQDGYHFEGEFKLPKTANGSLLFHHNSNGKDWSYDQIAVWISWERKPPYAYRNASPECINIDQAKQIWYLNYPQILEICGAPYLFRGGNLKRIENNKKFWFFYQKRLLMVLRRLGHFLMCWHQDLQYTRDLMK